MVATWAGHKYDGFDHALAADTAKGYFSGSTGVQVATANTRFNRGYGQQVSSLEVRTTSNHSTWRWAGVLKRSSGPYSFFQLLDGGSFQVGAKITSGGDIEIFTSGPTVIGTASSVIPTSSWLWVEILITIHGSTGAALVFVSDTTTPVLSLTNVDTQSTGNAYANAAFMIGDTTLSWDDVHISYGSGTVVAADALPDSTIISNFALTQGDHLDFTPDSGTNHVDRVRDATAGVLADGDATYLSSNTAAHKESMLFDDLPTDITDINGVQITAEIRKNDAAARTVRVGTRRSGTDTNGATVNAIDTYQLLDFTQVLDPQTSAAWTRANVNATQGKVELVS